MIRQRLELMVGKISDSLFHKVMEATKLDIVANQILFKRKTSFDTLIDRAVIAVNIYKACWWDRCFACDSAENYPMANYCFNCGTKFRH